MESDQKRDKKGRFVKGVSYSIDTQFKKGQHSWRKPRPHWKKEWWVREYIDKKRSAPEIGKEIKCTEANVYHWLKKFGIDRRTISEVRKIKKWGLAGEKNGMYGKCGKLNPNWVDGSSSERKDSYTKLLKIVLKMVKERDNFKCVKCCSNIKLQTHHIKRWAGNLEKRYSPDNIVTLCKKCHNWVHSKENINNEFL